MAANPKNRKPTRAERLAAAAAARRRRQFQVRAAIAGGVALVVGIAAFVFVSDRRDRNELVKRLESGSCQYDNKSDDDQGSAQSRNHVAAPTYTVEPPSGGDHLAQPAPAGRYTLANTPPDGQLVHSLEHGYIVLWHRPDVDEATMRVVNEIADRHDRDVLTVPRPSLPTPVAATAWHDRLLCQAPDAEALERFVDRFANKGPERVPH